MIQREAPIFQAMTDADWDSWLNPISQHADANHNWIPEIRSFHLIVSDHRSDLAVFELDARCEDEAALYFEHMTEQELCDCRVHDSHKYGWSSEIIAAAVAPHRRVNLSDSTLQRLARHGSRAGRSA